MEILRWKQLGFFEQIVMQYADSTTPLCNFDRVRNQDARVENETSQDRLGSCDLSGNQNYPTAPVSLN